jgi:hypothetical protein
MAGLVGIPVAAVPFLLGMSGWPWFLIAGLLLCLGWSLDLERRMDRTHLTAR